MDYRNLTFSTWGTLSSSGSLVTGYRGIYLSKVEGHKSSLHIFIDEAGKYHLAIEVVGSETGIEDPEVNGLTVSVNSYRIEDSVKRLIDLQCNSQGNLREFTEIVKEISGDILEDRNSVINIVNRVIRNWKTFWAKQPSQCLTPEEVRGLIAELLVLRRLCKVNPANALHAWRGPLAERHDFSFTKWSFEVKGSLSETVIINGLEQLSPVAGKQLAIILIILAASVEDNSITLPGLVEDIYRNSLAERPDLLVLFNELLASGGYSPVDAPKYLEYSFQIQSERFFGIDDSFPRIVPEVINIPLDKRITRVSYGILLAGLDSIQLEEIAIGDYCY